MVLSMVPAPAIPSPSEYQTNWTFVLMGISNSPSICDYLSLTNIRICSPATPSEPRFAFCAPPRYQALPFRRLFLSPTHQRRTAIPKNHHIQTSICVRPVCDMNRSLLGSNRHSLECSDAGSCFLPLHWKLKRRSIEDGRWRKLDHRGSAYSRLEAVHEDWR